MIKNRFSIRKKSSEAQEESSDLLQGYESYTQKEIFSQAEIIKNTARKYIKNGRIKFDTVKINFDKIKRIYILGNGSDYACALAAAYNTEVLCDIPAYALSVFEFNCSNPILDKSTLVIIISKTDKEEDFLQAEKRARESGAKSISLCSMGENSENSISLGITERGELPAADFLAKYLTASLLAVYIGDKTRVVTQLYKSIAINAALSLHKKIAAVAGAEEIISTVADRIDCRELIVTGANVDYAQSIYISMLLTEAEDIPVFALPYDRIDGRHCKNIIALTSCTELNRVLPDFDLQMLVLPSNISAGKNTSISYEETLPLLNPIISCAVFQLIAYSKLEKRKGRTLQEKEENNAYIEIPCENEKTVQSG